MHKLLNACLVLAALFSGYVLYSHEHSTRSAEREIAKIKGGINDEREQMKLLNAEWASLTRADRLEQFATRDLKLVPLTAKQFVMPEELTGRLPERAVTVEAKPEKDAIADIIKEMQEQ